MKYVQHTVMAVAFQIGFAVPDFKPEKLIVGGAAASCYFFGREIAQAEYRWIEAFGGGLRANMGTMDRFDPRVWKLTDILDFALPALVTTALNFIL